MQNALSNNLYAQNTGQVVKKGSIDSNVHKFV